MQLQVALDRLSLEDALRQDLPRAKLLVEAARAFAAALEPYRK